MSWAKRITWRCPRPVPPTSQEIAAAYKAQVWDDWANAFSRATGIRLEAIAPVTDDCDQHEVTR